MSVHMSRHMFYAHRYSPQITLASVVGTSYLTFTYAPSPDVSLSVYNAPSSGNALIRLFGHDFDIDDRTPSATMGVHASLHGTLCLTTSWSSWTVLQCRAQFFFLTNISDHAFQRRTMIWLCAYAWRKGDMAMGPCLAEG